MPWNTVLQEWHLLTDCTPAPGVLSLYTFARRKGPRLH